MTVLETLCMGCMMDKGTADACPHCGFLEPDPAPSRAHLPPRIVLRQRYLVGRVLGAGGFGVTYLGWDQILALRVAIKEFLPHHLATRGVDGRAVQIHSGEQSVEFAYGLEQFLNEARRLARFADHPGIAAVRDFFTANQTGYLVMNYLEGMTLQDYLARRGGRIPIAQALAILTPVMDTLREVHAAGLLHRDISPDNLFLPTGKPTKLIDFGAARAALTERSGTLSVIIKPGYAPEEQYRVRGQQGPWTDVYALGATFYHALTGERPPPALDRLYQDTLPPLAALGAIVPSALEPVLFKALAVRSEQRFQTVAEFQSALTTVMTASGIVAQTPIVGALVPAVAVAANQPDSEDGEVLNDRYRLIGKREQAASSATLLALDQTTGQRCVIKQFFLRRADDWKSVELFEREAKTLKQLDHPNIPRYLDYFILERSGDQQLFLVREYLPGQTLTQCLADGRHFVDRDVLAIARALARVLCYLHQFSPPFIHRDIKPDSILLGENRQVYLLDFGAVLDRLKPDEGMTVVGTDGYLPPEQRKGHAVAASDLYALGATLIHLLSRIPPSRLQDRDQRLQFHAQVNISAPFTAILEKMVEPNLERRYRAAAELLADLRALEAPARRERRAAPPFDPRGWAAGLVGLLFLGSVLALIWWHRSEPEPREVPWQPTVTETLPKLQRAVQEGLMKAAMVKTAIAEHFATMGKLPATLGELGLPEPSAYRSTLIESLAVVDGGVIVIQLNGGASAGGGSIHLKPSANAAVGFVEWQCFSPDLKQIASIAQGCVYQPGATLAARRAAQPTAATAAAGSPDGSMAASARPRVMEGVIAANQAQAAVARYHATRNALPNDGAAVGLENAAATQSRYVRALTIGPGGVITVVFQNLGPSELDGKTLVYLPQAQERWLRWDCARQSTLPRELRPAECQR